MSMGNLGNSYAKSAFANPWISCKSSFATKLGRPGTSHLDKVVCSKNTIIIILHK